MGLSGPKGQFTGYIRLGPAHFRMRALSKKQLGGRIALRTANGSDVAVDRSASSVRAEIAVMLPRRNPGHLRGGRAVRAAEGAQFLDAHWLAVDAERCGRADNGPYLIEPETFIIRLLPVDQQGSSTATAHHIG